MCPAGRRGILYQSLTESQKEICEKTPFSKYSIGMDLFKGEVAPAEMAPAAPVSVGRALGGLLRNPWQTLLRWNRKAALLSALFRGGVFLAASLKSHHAGRSHAVLAEAAFGAVFMGFFGTVTQTLRLAEPQWLVELLLAGVFPLLFQVGDICFHSALGTQAFRSGMIASAVFTALSALFNLYIMRRGTLLVGEESSSFAQDLIVLPKLAVMFVVSGVLRAWRVAAGIGRGISGDMASS